MAKTETTALENEKNPLDYLTFEFNGETYRVRKKYRRLSFLRKMSEGDMIGAFDLAFDEDELERLESLDLEDKELEDLLEIMSKAMVGGKGNS